MIITPGILTYNCADIWALVGYYAVSCGNCLPTFRYNVSVQSSFSDS
jgi:hypothetical protein